MTENGRRQHIAKALDEVRDRMDRGQVDTFRLPMRKGLLLEVIDVDLDIPLLNENSFRIAAQLEDHPLRDLVRSNPASVEAQAVIAKLVRDSHRLADDLKANLADEGQMQPGLITREGKLINANTRCVLLRELRDAGDRRARSLQVAVLPTDMSNRELLELEMIVQQQVELKDEYRLVNKLLMIKRLHDEGLSDDNIARKLRETGGQGKRGGAKHIADLRLVLRLMEHARRLPTTPIPLSDFDSDVSKQQNWLELLRKVTELRRQSEKAADREIAQWMIAYFAGVDAVHKLRYATENWLELGGVMERLQEDDDLRSIMANPSPEIPIPNSGDEPEDDLGLDLLGSEEDAPEATSAPIRGLLDVVVAAKRAGHDPVELPNGSTRAGSDVTTKIRESVEEGLGRMKYRKQAGTRLERPVKELEKARTALREAMGALSEISFDAEVASIRPRLEGLLSEVIASAEELRQRLEAAELAPHDSVSV